MSDHEKVPENALFVCFGAMSSSGTLTGIAVLEAMKRLDPEKTGIFCSSALAVDVPKHRKTTEVAKRIIAIDGCAIVVRVGLLKRQALRWTGPSTL